MTELTCDFSPVVVEISLPEGWTPPKTVEDAIDFEEEE